jgi:site-specific DNA-adenine methylase
MKSYKTPLRYPGGKSRACVKMDQYIPDLRDFKEYREPFLGGGSVAIHITKKYPHLNVWVNDLYEPLVNFWKTLQDDGHALYKRLQELKSRYPDVVSAKGLFLEAKELVNDDSVSPLYRACSFYVIISYNSSQLIKDRFKEYQAGEFDLTYTMRSVGEYMREQKDRKELLLYNYGIEALAELN